MSADANKPAANAKAAKAVATKGGNAQAAASEDAPRSKLSWVVGWVLMPATVLGLIFGSGVVLGAHLHDSWFVRAVVWVVGLFA